MSLLENGWLKLPFALYHNFLKWLVYGFAALAAMSIISMMLITCADVVLRFFNRPIKGTYDLVQIFGALTITGALPYTTAVKGHVAIEFLYHRLPRLGRVGMDTFLRLLAMVLFGFLAFKSIQYGDQLKNTGQVTLTLGVPLFWVPYLIAVSSALVVLVIFDNLLHPGKEMIKP